MEEKGVSQESKIGTDAGAKFTLNLFYVRFPQLENGSVFVHRIHPGFQTPASSEQGNGQLGNPLPIFEIEFKTKHFSDRQTIVWIF